MNLIISKNAFTDYKNRIEIKPSNDSRYIVNGYVVAHIHSDGNIHVCLKYLQEEIKSLKVKRVENEIKEL